MSFCWSRRTRAAGGGGMILSAFLCVYRVVSSGMGGTRLVFESFLSR